MFIEPGISYNGIHSNNFQIDVIRLDTGFVDGQFGVKRSLTKEKIPGIPYPISYGFDYESLIFKLQLCPKDGCWTTELKRNVVDWLFQKDYKPLISDDNKEIVYYCLPIGDPRKHFIDLNYGYVEIDFECNSPWGFTLLQTDRYDFSNTSSVQVININNCSNIHDIEYVYPEVEFTLFGDSTGISLKNNSIITSFTGLNTGEKIYFCGGNKQRIISNLGLFRLNKFNGNWLKLHKGINTIEVTGKCKIDLRYQFPICT